MAEKELFEPYTVFKRLSSKETFITSSDIFQFLKDNNINISVRDSYLLIKLYDSNTDGKLSFTEFINGILPQDDDNLRRECASRKSYDTGKNNKLPYDIEYGVSRIFEEEINALNQINNLKAELNNYLDFSPLEAFKYIDTDNYGGINKKK